MKLRVLLINLFPRKNKENSLERNACQKKTLEIYRTSKLCGGFIGVPEIMKTRQITKRYTIQAEIRKSKRSYEQILACNIKNESKSFYAYVRSKQKV